MISHGKLRIAAVLALISGAMAAHAQRLIVETVTLSAMKSAERVYIQSADLTAGTVIPFGFAVAGARPEGPPVVSVDRRVAAFTSGRAAGPAWTQRFDGDSHVCVVTTSPLSLVPVVMSPLANDSRAGCWAYDPVQMENVLLTSNAGDASVTTWRGGDGGAIRAGATWPLPGTVVAMVLMNGRGRAAFLCASRENGEAVLHVRDVLTGQVLAERVPLAHSRDAGIGAEPADVFMFHDGQSIGVLTSGRPIEGDAVTATWLQVFDAASFFPVGIPLMVSGEAVFGAHASETAATCWISSRSSETNAGSVARVSVMANSVEIVSERAFGGLLQHALVATHPSHRGTVVGAGNRIEMWAGAETSGTVVSFDSPVRAVSWSDAGVVVGEGNRVHRLVWPSGDIARTISFQTGQVANIMVVPESMVPNPDQDADGLEYVFEVVQGTSDLDWDTDKDGIPDSIDPQGFLASPILSAPERVVFRGEAAGSELKVLDMTPGFAEGWTFGFDADPTDAPWLRAFPRFGTPPEQIYLGVDPGPYGMPAGAVTAWATVTLTRDGMHAFGSPAHVALQVLPARGDVLRMLWLLGESAAPVETRAAVPQRYERVVEHLRGAPFFASHHFGSESPDRELDGYRLVVLDARFAIEGALTRQAVLEYVAGGGSLLFVGHHLDSAEAARALARWLAPAGIHINAAERVDGAFAASSKEWVARHWDHFTIEDGCSIRVDSAARMHVRGTSDANYGVFAVAGYGWGRIAVLSSDTPITDPAIGQRSNLRFTSDVIEWLLRAPRDLKDLDSDGLPDHIEDKNGNSARDPGETDRFNPDTDSDGIRDGAEDANRNGDVDPGETSPLNFDSDGDGVWDGADTEPSPAPDAPQIIAVHPNQSPAEGGGRVLVSGQNFSPDSQLWFGTQRARSVRMVNAETLMAEAPASENFAAGSVDVRVVNPSSERSGNLPAGFRYLERTQVSIATELVSSGSNEFVLAVLLQCPPRIEAGRISFRVEPLEGAGVEWLGVSPGSLSAHGKRRVVHRPSPLGGLFVDVSEGVRGPSTGEIVRIRYRTSDGAQSAVSIEGIRVMAPNGQAYAVAAKLAGL